MQPIIIALWPVFALLLLGFLARRSGFPGEDFWQPAEKATYYVLFPALLVERLASAQLAGDDSIRLAALVVVVLVVAAVLCCVCKPLLRLTAPAFTSFFQGSVRFNTYVALAVTAALHGSEGIVLAAVITAVMIPLLNLFSVLAFALTSEQTFSPRQLLMTLAGNPLILACLLGIALSLSGIALPLGLSSVLELLGRMALPLGLLAVGAGLNLRALRGGGRALAAASLIKLLFLPLLAFALAGVWQLDPLATSVVVIFAAVPTATSAYILARQMGGDAELMAGIITAQTLISMLTLPVILVLL
ncbi:AEC family transporter [Marinobacterium sp. MBR-109]|jgi:predicted permease|uniref:AEC family transporter n=1 Tax=Marinobacterium sp. MBR-109 TaxID=3156462 RepID=UPI00339B8E78